MEVFSSDQTQTDAVHLRFVLNEGYTPETCPSIMLAAYQLCEENNIEADWIQEAELVTFRVAGKKDIFVMEPFEGTAFEHINKLSQTKCVVIGPHCLTYCIMHKHPIPEYLFPMHNMAMYGVVVTCTGLSVAEKENIEKLVQHMAGMFSKDLHLSVTHVIAGAVDSKKYRIAQEKELPVMKASWVHAVWEAMGGSSTSSDSPGGTVKATDQKFLSHVCPVFLNQVVCVSQLPRKDKLALQKLVEDNGGTYTATLDMQKTTLLVLLDPNGDKHKHAVAWQIPCVTPEYVYDSLQAGYALNTSLYKVKERSASTPTKGGKMLPPDVSLCSTIADTTLLGGGPHVNETVAGDNSIMSGIKTGVMPSGRLSNGPSTNEKMVAGAAALDHLSLADASQAGLFLDGCKIYLSGWAEGGTVGGGRAEKLRKLLNRGGATRFNQLTEAVSHIIMGSFQGDTVATVKSWTSRPHFVSALWLIESIKLKRAADEAGFVCVEFEETTGEGDVVSHGVHGNNRRMSRVCDGANDTTFDFNNCENNPNYSNIASRKSGNSSSGADAEGYSDDDILKQYQGRPSTAGRGVISGAVANALAQTKERISDNVSFNDSTVLSSQATQQQIFNGLSFLISGYEPLIQADLEENLPVLGARVLSYDTIGPTDHVDYCMVNVTGEGMLHPGAVHYVTHHYVEDCVDAERVLDVEYYHMPLLMPEQSCPLEGVVAAMSSYTGRERNFLTMLINKLGGIFQDMFARKDNPSKGVQRCSYLVCPNSVGDKYRASVKWGIPAVTRDWLLACVREGRRVDEGAFKPEAEVCHNLDAKEVFMRFVDEHIAACSPAPDAAGGDPDDSTMIAPTPRPTKAVVALRGSCSKAGEGRAVTTPGKPTTPSAVHTPDLETMRRLYPTPGRNLNPNNSLDAMATPNTPYGCTWETNPSKQTRKAYKRMLDSMPENNYDRMIKRQKKQEEVLIAQSKQMNDNIKRVLGYDPDVTEENGDDGCGGGGVSCKQIAERVGGDTDTKRRGPLVGCVVYVPKNFEPLEKVICSKVNKLGGDYRCAYDATVTHVVFKGRANEMSKEVKNAKESGKKLVSPEWVSACYDKQAWLDENGYPYTHNPNRSLTIISKKLSPSKVNATKSKRAASSNSVNEDADGSLLERLDIESRFGEATVECHDNETLKENPAFTDTTNAQKEESEFKHANNSVCTSALPVQKPAAAFAIEETAENTQVVRELEELEKLAAASCNTQTQSLPSDGEDAFHRLVNVPKTGLTPASMGLPPCGRASLILNSGRRRSLRRRTGDGDREDGHGDDSDHHLPPVGTMELAALSQQTNIAWVDPMDREARLRLACPDQQRKSSGGMEEQAGGSSDNDVTQPFEVPQRRFLLSNINVDAEKEHMVAVITALGGVMCDETSPAGALDMTHLITSKPSRSEKNLAAIAGGKWMLMPSYIVECEKAAAFVDERDHEWGSAASASSLTPGSQVAKLAAAAHRWRTLGGGAFTSWNALVVGTAERAAAFARLLQAGGGVVCTERSILGSSVDRTSCICHDVTLANCPYTDRRTSHQFNTTRRRVSESNCPKGLTHCFVEMRRNPAFDLALFAKNQVPCLEPVFINDFLLEDPPPKPLDNCIQLYKDIVANMTKDSCLR